VNEPETLQRSLRGTPGIRATVLHMEREGRLLSLLVEGQLMEESAPEVRTGQHLRRHASTF